jgi:hypothetical protein
VNVARALCLAVLLVVPASCGPKPTTGFVGLDYASVCARLGTPAKTVGDPAKKAVVHYFKPLSIRGERGTQATAWFENGVCTSFEGWTDGQHLRGK